MPIMTGTCPKCKKYSYWTEEEPCKECNNNREIFTISEETQSKMSKETKTYIQMNWFELTWCKFKKIFGK